MEDSSQSSLTGRGKNKRFWKREEEEALIDGLLELKANPEWKAEGGFKNGYMLVLEKMLHEKFPACGLKAVPHIESKVKWFKDKYAVVNEMIIRTSGFKWDDEKKMIQCERQAYDDFCKTHPKAKGLWMTPFPFLDKLDMLFGLDRANGIESEDIEESVQNLEREFVNVEQPVDDSFTGDDMSTNDNQTERPAKRMRKEITPTGRMKRKTVVDLTSVNKMCDNFSGAIEDMSTHLATIAKCMSSAEQRDEELADQKKKLLAEISMLQGLSMDQAIDAAVILSSNPNQLDVFYSSPNDEWKLAFIYKILGVQGGSNP